MEICSEIYVKESILGGAVDARGGGGSQTKTFRCTRSRKKERERERARVAAAFMEMRAVFLPGFVLQRNWEFFLLSGKEGKRRRVNRRSKSSPSILFQVGANMPLVGATQ
jgi:hypothetical protein